MADKFQIIVALLWFFGYAPASSVFKAPQRLTRIFLKAHFLFRLVMSVLPLFDLFDIYYSNDPFADISKMGLPTVTMQSTTIISHRISAAVVRIRSTLGAAKARHLVSFLTKVGIKTTRPAHDKHLSIAFAFATTMTIYITSSSLYDYIVRENKMNSMIFGVEASFLRSIYELIIAFAMIEAYAWAYVFVIVFCLYLVEVHSRISSALVSLWHNEEEDLTSADLPNLIRGARRAFRDYMDLAGAYVFWFVAEIIVCFISFGCAGIWTKWDLGWDTWISSVLLWIGLGSLVHVGSVSQRLFKSNKEALHNAMVEGWESRKEDFELRRLTNWVLDWKWTITAQNIFVLDYNVLCVVIGTVFAYFIILFQLTAGARDGFK